ncbi:MAG: J domain-containing protein, partial [Chloroflexota bacterium]
MEYKDYYKILGVNKSSDEKEIKRAYRKLAREYHPDKNPNNEAAEEKFKEINEAYEVIGNPDNRAKYDQLGANYHRYKQMGGNPNDFFSQWANQGGQQGGFDFSNLGDLFGGAGGGGADFFETFFGGGGGRQGGFGGRQQQVSLDIDQTVEITLDEAYSGTTRTFSQNGNRFTAKIPAGARDGMKIRLRGKGKQSPYGVGDLLLMVKIMPHALYERKGHNLRTEVAVDVLKAVLGGKITVPTMTGDVKLTIPAGTQGGQAFRLKGRGMPLVKNKEQFGDLVATVSIRIPKELSDAERVILSLNEGEFEYRDSLNAA